MRNSRGLVVAGLSVAMIAGCASNTGNTFAAGSGECLPSHGEWLLGPDKTLDMGGTITYRNGETSYLRLKNMGKAVLQLTRSSDDKGSLELGGSVVKPNGDSDNNSDLHVTVNVGPLSGLPADKIVYSEGKSVTSLDVFTSDSTSVTISYDTTCK